MDRHPLRAPDKADHSPNRVDELRSGIEVAGYDLLEPYAKGGKIGLFGGAGVGKTAIY